MALRIEVPAFPEGGDIPATYTCDGGNRSPEIRWNGEPKETASFVLIVDDPDAPAGTWTHWIVYDIPRFVHKFPEGWRPDASEAACAVNDFGRSGYGGPCPPKGHGPHRYYFRIYALDTDTLGLNDKPKRADVDRALRTHILEEAHFMGRYERK
ncbi:MAG: YbhB/YbcL family Raf kinase inhibitor-like protein [Bryobacteraceae bacterium]